MPEDWHHENRNRASGGRVVRLSSGRFTVRGAVTRRKMRADGAIVRSAAQVGGTAPPARWKRVNTMSPEEITAVLLGLPEVTEEEPFEADVPVYKVAGK